MRTKANALLRKVNVHRILWTHLLGKNHSHVHRMSTGGILMVVGVLIAAIHAESIVMHIVIDGGGYLLHGLGAVPFIEKISEQPE